MMRASPAPGASPGPRRAAVGAERQHPRSRFRRSDAEEGLAELAAGEKLLARPLADDAAGLDDVAAVGEVERRAHVLFDQQDRHAFGLHAPTHLVR